MKKILLSIGGGLAVFVFSVCITFAAKPNKSQGPHEKTTGDFTAYAGATSLTMTLDAHGTDPVKGSVKYSNSLGKHFSGNVSNCYFQDGSKSAFSGVVTEGNYTPNPTYFKVEVWDKGEGDKADGPDVVRVTFPSSPNCTLSNSFPGVVGEGNIQVHKETEEEITSEVSSANIGNGDETCATIADETIINSAGDIIKPGFDLWGYNYQAHLFVGGYCDAYRDAAWCQPYKDIQIVMKWNDAWLSNKDCDGDGYLDRHYGHSSYIGSGAWETNHQWGSYEEGEEMINWNYFTKIVAAPSDATLNGGLWYTSDGKEIGPSIWGEFATIQEVYNEEGTGDHGIYYKGARPSFGNW